MTKKAFMPLIPLKALYGGIRTKTQELRDFKSSHFPKSKNSNFFILITYNTSINPEFFGIFCTHHFIFLCFFHFPLESNYLQSSN
jgi:hypothetical protein